MYSRNFTAPDVSIFKVYIQRDVTFVKVKTCTFFSFFFCVTAVGNAVVLAHSRDDRNALEGLRQARDI